MTAFITADKIGEIAAFFEALPEATIDSLVFAVNDTASDTVPSLGRSIKRQVAFPNGYLNRERLGVRRRANRATLEAVISGRDRPTSLARFAPGATPENSRGRPLFVKVKPGKTVQLNRAFMVRLKNNNLGLAVRLRPGESLRNSEKAQKLGKNLYLLYGPSVDQVMRDVAEQSTPRIQEKLLKEFLRQFARISSNG